MDFYKESLIYKCRKDRISINGRTHTHTPLWTVNQRPNIVSSRPFKPDYSQTDLCCHLWPTIWLCSFWGVGGSALRAKVAMGTTSAAALLLFAALAHLKAELSRISLCQACVILLHFLTLQFHYPLLATHLNTHTQTHIHNWVEKCVYWLWQSRLPCLRTQMLTSERRPPLHFQRDRLFLFKPFGVNSSGSVLL